MQRKSFWQFCYHLLGSIKLTVFVLLAVAAGSFLGTLLPQGLSDRELVMHFGSTRAAWIKFFGIQNLYHSGWFQLLLGLLSVNLIVCTLNRLPKTRKLLRHRDIAIRPQKLAKFSHHRELITSLPFDKAITAIENVLTQQFSTPKTLTNENPYTAIAEKGRWSHWMIYVVHFSVLVILCGALIGSIFGFKGFMNIYEGDASHAVHLFGNFKVVQLPFDVRCDRFQVSYYDNGAPKEYRSDLTILENGKKVLERTIRVNDPLTYKGVTFYQASYGSTLKDATIRLIDPTTEQVYTMTLPFRTMRPLPGSEAQVQIVQYRDDFRGFGPALAIGIFKEGEQPRGSWILADHPKFHGNRIAQYKVQVLHLNKSSYTGLQVKRDPGVWLVLTGFATLLVGLGATFYTSHRKLWVWAARDNPTTRVIIAGRTNKNSLAFEAEFNDLCKQLQEELKNA